MEIWVRFDTKNSSCPMITTSNFFTNPVLRLIPIILFEGEDGKSQIFVLILKNNNER